MTELTNEIAEKLITKLSENDLSEADLTKFFNDITDKETKNKLITLMNQSTDNGLNQVVDKIVDSRKVYRFNSKIDIKFYDYEEDGERFIVRNVELFTLSKNAQGAKIDKAFVERMIKNYEEEYNKKGYRPTVFVGHNSPYSEEKPAEAFIENMRLLGDRIVANFIGNLKTFKENLKKFPYRSVEIINGNLRGCALLGSNSPFFKNAPTIYSENNNVIYINNLNNLSMEKLKKFAQKLLINEKISQSDVDSFNEELVKLSDEEQKQFSELQNDITKKFEEDNKEPVETDEKKEEPKEDQKDDESNDKKDEPKSQKVPESQNVKASETISMSASQFAEIKAMAEKANMAEAKANQAYFELRDTKISQKYSELVVNEKGNGVLLPKDLDKAVNLAKKFADIDESLENEFHEFVQNSNPNWSHLFQDKGIVGKKPEANKFKDSEKAFKEMGLSEEETKYAVEFMEESK